MSREDIPVVLKDAQLWKIWASFHNREEQALFHRKVCFSCLLHPALSGRGCCQVRAAPPSTALCACFSLALHFLAWIFLLLVSPWWVSHSCDIHSEVDIASSNLFYQSHVVACGDTNHRIYFAFLSLHCFSRFLLWFLLIQTVKLLPILSSSSWFPIINAVLGLQVPFVPQICKISKLRKSLGQTLTAHVSIKDLD